MPKEAKAKREQSYFIIDLWGFRLIHCTVGPMFKRQGLWPVLLSSSYLLGLKIRFEGNGLGLRIRVLGFRFRVKVKGKFYCLWVIYSVFNMSIWDRVRVSYVCFWVIY